MKQLCFQIIVYLHSVNCPGVPQPRRVEQSRVSVCGEEERPLRGRGEGAQGGPHVSGDVVHLERLHG